VRPAQMSTPMRPWMQQARGSNGTHTQQEKKGLKASARLVEKRLEASASASSNAGATLSDHAFHKTCQSGSAQRVSVVERTMERMEKVLIKLGRFTISHKTKPELSAINGVLCTSTALLSNPLVIGTRDEGQAIHMGCNTEGQRGRNGNKAS
jgi:hypothetical protein